MPEMAFRMGRDLSQFRTLSRVDQNAVLPIIPAQSMVTDEEWAAILRYYDQHAPDSLPLNDSRIAHTLTGFVPERHLIGTFPLHTFTFFDSAARTFLVGSRLNKLFLLNEQLQTADSVELGSPPSKVMKNDDGSLLLLLMGIMDPNDQAAGKLVRFDWQTRSAITLIDSLKRPVDFERTDLDRDGLEDYVICSFGNYTGNLEAFRNRGNGTFERRTLVNLPGARRVIIRDFDNNGLPDVMALMTQGNERLILLLNQGKFEFRATTLLTFPPVYGSSSIELADMNGDGKLDILYTNGDNADYSITLKPYHGVRVFLNNGKNEFKESWFHPMHGASEAVAADFDGDGDMDIAAVSFFPPFADRSAEGFVFFENTGGSYRPHTLAAARDGRWLRIGAKDVDGDGDTDILLTALDFNRGVPEDLLADWKSNPVSILLLRNQLR